MVSLYYIPYSILILFYSKVRIQQGFDLQRKSDLQTVVVGKATAPPQEVSHRAGRKEREESVV